MILNNITPNIYTYNILIDALCKEGKIKQAKNVLAMRVRAYVKPTIVTLNTLMDGYYLVNEVKKCKICIQCYDPDGNNS